MSRGFLFVYKAKATSQLYHPRALQHIVIMFIHFILAKFHYLIFVLYVQVIFYCVSLINEICTDMSLHPTGSGI